MSKVCLVTGGASGIGAAVARIAAARGFSVAVNYKSRREQAETLVAELRTLGARAVALQADVSEPRQIETLYERVKQDLGTPDAVLNSAGVATSACASRTRPRPI